MKIIQLFLLGLTCFGQMIEALAKSAVSDVKNTKIHVNGLSSNLHLHSRLRIPLKPLPLPLILPERLSVVSVIHPPANSAAFQSFEEKTVQSAIPEVAHSLPNHIPVAAIPSTDQPHIPQSLQVTLNKHFSEEQIKDLWEWAESISPPQAISHTTPSARGLAKFKNVQLLKWSQGTYLPEKGKFMPEDGFLLRKLEYLESEVVYHKLTGDIKRAQEFRGQSLKLQTEIVDRMNSLKRSKPGYVDLDVNEFPTLEQDLKDWRPDNVNGDGGGLFKKVIEWDAKVAQYLYKLKVSGKHPKARAKEIENWAYERSKHLL